MGWLRGEREAVDGGGGGDGEGHASPVQIDVGFQQRPWELEMLVTSLEGEGLKVHLTTQSQIPEMGGGLGPKRCLLLVQPDDEARVRSELTAAGFL